MQKTYTTKELQMMFASLPKDVRGAIFDSNVSERIAVVGKRNGLTVDQLGVLGSEVGLVLLGATSVADFVSVLIEKLKINKDAAVRLAENINGEIFSPIRESLKQVHGVEDLRFSEPKEEYLSAKEENRPTQPLQPLKEQVPLPKKEPMEINLPAKEEILGEIEKEENLPAKIEPKEEALSVKTEEKDLIPDIFKGKTSPTPFEVKNEQEIFRNPPQKTDYTQANLDSEKYAGGVDPYRELPE